MRRKIKKKIKLVILLIILTISLLFVLKKDNKYQSIDNDNALAIYLENENGKYIKSGSNSWPQKENKHKYSFSHTECVDSKNQIVEGDLVTFNGRKREAQLVYNKTVFCNLYFNIDVYPPLIFEGNFRLGGIENPEFTKERNTKIYILFESDDTDEYCISKDDTYESCEWIKLTDKERENKVINDREYDLGDEDGLIIRYAFLRDDAGNVSVPIKDDITLDQHGPQMKIDFDGVNIIGTIIDNPSGVKSYKVADLDEVVYDLPVTDEISITPYEVRENKKYVIKSKDGVNNESKHEITIDSVNLVKDQKKEYTVGTGYTCVSNDNNAIKCEIKDNKVVITSVSGGEGFVNVKKDDNTYFAYLIRSKDAPKPATITPEDGIASNEWHNNTTRLTFSYEDNIEEIDFYYGTDPTSLTTKGSSVLPPDSSGTNTYYVKVCYKINPSICSEITSYVLKIDKSAPIISVSVINGTTYSNQKSATILVSDSGSGLANEAITINYAWGTSAVACRNMTKSVTITPSNNQLNITKNVTISGETGAGKIYICNKEPIKDAMGNSLSVPTVPLVYDNMYLDNTPPTCSISGVPTAYVQEATLTQSGTDAHNGIVHYSWDNNNYSTEAKQRVISSNGTYTSYVKDGLGNSNTCSVNVTRIDGTVPTFTVTNSNSANYARSHTATVRIADSSGLKNGTYNFKYAWGTSAVACNSMTNTTRISVSGNTTEATASITVNTGTGNGNLYVCNSDAIYDVAGNSFAASTRRAVAMKLDNTPPTCNINGNTNSWTTSKTLTQDGSDTLSTPVSYSWDDNSNYSTQKSSKIVNRNGTYRLYVKDAVGNETSCTESVTTVDSATAAPTVTIKATKTGTTTEVSSGTWSNKGLVFVLTQGNTNYASGTTILYCKDINNTCTPTERATSGSAINKYLNTTGTYYIRYKIQTGAGLSSNVLSYTAKVDLAPPTIQVQFVDSNGNVMKDSGIISGSSYTFNGDKWFAGSHYLKVIYGESGGSGMKSARVDGNSSGYYSTLNTTYSNWSTSTSGFTSTNTVAGGQRAFKIKVTDNAGNEKEVIVYAKIDNVGPTWTELTNPSNGNWKNEDVTLTFKGNDNGSGIQGYKFSNNGCGGTFNSTVFGLDENTWGEGNRTIGIKLVDNLGNESICRETTLKIDKKAPTLNSITNSSNGNWTNGDVTLTPKATDTGGSGLSTKYLYNHFGCDKPFNEFELTDGKNVWKSEQNTTVYIRTQDNAGNRSNCLSTNVKIDKTAPTLNSITNSSNGNWTNGNVTLTPNATDTAGSGLSTKYLYNHSGCDKPFNEFELTDGKNVWKSEQNTTVYIRAQDNVGNRSNCLSTNVKIDKTAPTIKVQLVDTNGNVMKDSGVISGDSYAFNNGKWFNGIYKLKVIYGESGGSGIKSALIKGNKSGYYSTLNTTYDSWSISTSGFTSKETLGGGQRAFIITVADIAGNTKTVTVTAKIDNTPPTISNTPSCAGCSSNITVSCDGKNATITDTCYSINGGTVTCKNGTIATPSIANISGNEARVSGYCKDANGNGSSANVTFKWSQNSVCGYTEDCSYTCTLQSTGDRVTRQLYVCDTNSAGVCLGGVSIYTKAKEKCETVYSNKFTDYDTGSNKVIYVRCKEACPEGYIPENNTYSGRCTGTYQGTCYYNSGDSRCKRTNRTCWHT